MIALSVWKELDDEQLRVTMRGVLDEYRSRIAGRLLAVVREMSSDRIKTVTFRTAEYTDGFFFAHREACVELADGTTAERNIQPSGCRDQLHDLLTKLGSTYSVGRDTKLIVKVRTGMVEVDG